MVSTRRSGATEPLERLETPPKRSRKPKESKKPKHFSPVPEASPEVVQAISVEALSQPFACISKKDKVESLTVPEATAPSTSTTKRRHEEDDDEEQQDDSSPTKRARTQPSTPAADDDYLFMFPKKVEEEDLERPVKGLGDSIRRKNYFQKRNGGRFNSTPRRRQPLVKLNGDNPFGIETFSQQELAEQKAAQQQPQASDQNREQREERSAAPEPETPTKGLFGSLRAIGSATIGRVLSPFTSNSQSARQFASPSKPQPRTEPRKRVPAWDIQYPQIEPAQNENAPPEDEEEGETETEKRRKAFETKYGTTNRKYDHLHTIPTDGEAENLPYPVKKNEPKPRSESEAKSEWSKSRLERKQKLFGAPRVKETPTIAPLFGPNSHYARGTKNPMYQAFFEDGEHPALRRSVGGKRKLQEALPEEAAASEKSARRNFQPYLEEDEEVTEEVTDEGLATPLSKKQKQTDIIPTPRSALKAPGTVRRAGRSARFNDNPVASIKRMSPISGSAPAGEASPNNLFGKFAEQVDESSTPSPTGRTPPDLVTGVYTYKNKVGKKHPGDALTESLRKGPMVEYLWKDPNNPEWKPTLEHPAPGTFRSPLSEEEEEAEYAAMLESERMQLDMSPEPTVPETPSTPRMSHAELPKPATTTESNVDFEKQNLEKRRAEASKSKPKKSSRLAEVTSARSRSPSPPGLDTDAGDTSDSSAKTPSPVLDQVSSIWKWSSETNEYISSVSNYPDFAYNPHEELIATFALKAADGSYDDTVIGPDNMTELQRQNFYANKYDDKWAAEMFPFDPPQTYEEAGVGSQYIHDQIRKANAKCPELVQRCDERFKEEWDAHQTAIEEAYRQGKRLVATYPDRDGIEMHDVDEDL